jgi:DNA-binding protein
MTAKISPEKGGYKMADDDTENNTDDMEEDMPEDEPKPKAKPKAKSKARDRADDNTVFIGKKPTMNYVLAVATQANSGADEVVIKARGKSISKAVDVAEIVRNRFVQDLNVDDIKITTEVLDSEDGRTSNVSSIEIFLKK